MTGTNTDNAKQITVVVDPLLKDIVPLFLEHTAGHVGEIIEALDKGDFEALRTLAHILQGTGGGFGFLFITEVGESLNRAAKEEKTEEVRKLVTELTSYLEHVDVIYEE